MRFLSLETAEHLGVRHRKGILPEEEHAKLCYSRRQGSDNYKIRERSRDAKEEKGVEISVARENLAQSARSRRTRRKRRGNTSEKRIGNDLFQRKKRHKTR